jgi:hypothetical protein
MGVTQISTASATSSTGKTMLREVIAFVWRENDGQEANTVSLVKAQSFFLITLQLSPIRSPKKDSCVQEAPAATT